ncbi:glycoside hydrolase family 99-like domain-containing protein [Glaciihabitans tibetensis]|uniref:glycoside hydrolase family 99-like domain-containing protein n=1 Tax=Glaciihabitans tibetensis TaxID=1266600 RepID=UPI001FE97CF9|nr:glycoside hydrolase family 99-like domain-containing protein [Glaciihabitans tibetensis]
MAKTLGALPAPVTPESFPAGFHNWVQRKTTRLKSDFPAQWRAQIVPDAAARPAVAVVMHVYYLDLVDEILEALALMPVDFDLIVTNASGIPLDLATDSLPNLSSVRVFDIQNHGRDILPLVSLVNADLLNPYDLILKVHTKRSHWREDHPDLAGSGEAWRGDFLTALLGSTQNIQQIIGAFATDPTLGVLTADGNVLGQEFWGGDHAIVSDLLRRVQLPPVHEQLRFASGSMYWARGFVLQGLRALDLSPEDFEAEHGQVDGTCAHAVERIIGILTDEAGYDTREMSAATLETIDTDAWHRFDASWVKFPRARVLPFYLPQFHRFPENDSWWGKGFTEWSNVAAGVPVYKGHNQPLLPADLGFYDLTQDSVREQQRELASESGIEGFMYYYYWFAGKKLMNLPIEALAASQSETPFCIMWANENFTRRWDGGEKNILIGQDYEHVPATQFIHDVMPLLTDARYIRIDGKPVLAVYRITQIPNYAEVLEYWKQAALDAGLEGLHLVTVDVGATMQGVEGTPADFGFDASLGFAPHNMKWSSQDRGGLEMDPRFEGNIMNYGVMAEHAENDLLDPVPTWKYPGVMVNFDNTARRQWMPDIWYGSNPYTFRRWLDASLSAVADRDFDRRVVFINAWNEWAESAVLEPSQRYGHTYLLAVRDALYR